jgi:hypothetical protein
MLRLFLMQSAPFVSDTRDPMKRIDLKYSYNVLKTAFILSCLVLPFLTLKTKGKKWKKT